MSNNTFEDQAKRALSYTKEGLDLLVEVGQLQNALSNLPKSKDYVELVQEIAAKEKTAVGLVQQSTLIIRDLLNQRHADVERLINSI
jgi:hypothetical protein